MKVVTPTMLIEENSVPTSKGDYCPSWCEQVHRETEEPEGFTIHWKGFGILPGEEKSVVKVWVAFEEGRQYSCGVEVDTFETHRADDIRALARDCLRAAEWMEANLASITPSSSQP